MLLEDEVVTLRQGVGNLLDERGLIDAVRDDPRDLVVVGDVEREVDERPLRIVATGRAGARRRARRFLVAGHAGFSGAGGIAPPARWFVAIMFHDAPRLDLRRRPDRVLVLSLHSGPSLKGFPS